VYIYIVINIRLDSPRRVPTTNCPPRRLNFHSRRPQIDGSNVVVKDTECHTMQTGKNDLLHTMSDHFSKIVNTPLRITTPLINFLPSQSLPLTVFKVYFELKAMDPHKSNSPTAIPTKILKECALELCYINHILNKSNDRGQVQEM